MAEEQYSKQEELEVIQPLFNPFPGLRPFDLEESHLFFGREGQSDEVLLKLSENRFVAIVGPSGSGKSSFTFCGVLPMLYGGFLADKGSKWDVVVTRPGAAPIENLSSAIMQLDESYQNAGENEKAIKRKINYTLLRSSSVGLVKALVKESRPSDRSILILVDQFEELFRFRSSINKEKAYNDTLAFINLLVEAVQYPDVPIYVALTMRSDFIGDCAQFSELTQMINDSHYLIPQMTRSQKRKAIEGPVAVGGGKISPNLVQQLLNDLGDNPDQLPILQHSLMRTWDFWSGHMDVNEVMDIRHYKAIGSMAEALSQHANEAYDELSATNQHVCEILFKTITEKRGDDDGVRRPTSLKEIALIADSTEDQVKEVVEIFRQPGRSLLTPAHGIVLNSDSIIDISHESLIRIWVRLRKWVADEDESASLYIRLAEAAAMHQQGKAGLWTTPDLQLALNWQSKQKPTIHWAQRYDPSFERAVAFLEYSREEYETAQRVKEMLAKRQLKRARRTALIFAFLMILAIGAGVFAFRQYFQAEANRIEAEKARDEADHQKEIAQDSEQAAILARAQAEREKEIAEEQRDIAEAATAEANRQRGIADQNAAEARRQSRIAQENERIAKINEEEANRQRGIADTEREHALDLRMISIGQAMAIKSVSEEDPTIKGLTAQQAYIFNHDHGGLDSDPYIYDGLYYATKTLKDDPYKSFTGHDEAVKSFEELSNGKYVYSTGSDGKILRFEAANPEKAPYVLEDSSSAKHAMALSANNRYLVTAGVSKTIEVFDLENIESDPIAIERGDAGEIREIIFDQDHKSFFTVGDDSMVRKWDFDSGKVIYTSQHRINHIEQSPDGKYLAMGEENGEINILDLANNSVFKFAPNNRSGKDAVFSLTFSKDGTKMAAGDIRGFVEIWRIDNIKQPILLKTLTRHKARVNDLEFSHDGSQLATASWDKTVRIWNMDKLNDLPIKLVDHEDWVWSIAFSPDDTKLLAGCRDALIRIWPTKLDYMANDICDKIDRNMTKTEWVQYVADLDDIKYEVTCSDLPEPE